MPSLLLCYYKCISVHHHARWCKNSNRKRKSKEETLDKQTVHVVLLMLGFPLICVSWLMKTSVWNFSCSQDSNSKTCTCATIYLSLSLSGCLFLLISQKISRNSITWPTGLTVVWRYIEIQTTQLLKPCFLRKLDEEVPSQAGYVLPKKCYYLEAKQAAIFRGSCCLR